MVNRRIIDQTEALLLSSDDYLVVDNTNLGTRKIQFTRLLSGATPLPPDYITGFEIVKMENTTISISSGYARSSDNLQNIQLSTSLIKDISTTFNLGNNAGCMPSGLTLQASTKYYIFAISTSGGQTDIIVDTNENCFNGLVDNVVVSNNFDKFVCIGSIMTDANSQISIISSYIENFPKNYKSTIIGWGIPDYTAGVSVSSGFVAPCLGLYRHYGIDVSGNVYVNGVQVDLFVWHKGSWAAHAGCTLLLDKGDIITITGDTPAANFYPFKVNS